MRAARNTIDPETNPRKRAEVQSSGPIGLDESDPNFLASVGRRVREARAQRGLSRKALSQEADVSERYLAQLESGTGNASIVLLRRVAVALHMRLSDLLESAEPAAEHMLIRRFLGSLPPQRLAEVLQRLTRDFGQEEAVRRKRITLVGLRGAGKTTLGIALAKTLRRRFVELDKDRKSVV